MHTPKDLKDIEVMQDTAPPEYEFVDTGEVEDEEGDITESQTASLPPAPPTNLESVRFPAILLLGQTGVGKSTFGNWLLGFDGDIGPFVTGNNSDSITKICHTKLIKINDRTYNVIDTPGLFDTYGDVKNEESLNKIADAINLCSYGIQAIVFVVERNCNSYSSKTMTIIKSFLGDQALDHMIVAFTCCNVNQTMDDQQLQKALNSNMKSFLTSVNNRYIVSPNPDLFHQGDDVVISSIEKAKNIIDSFPAAYTTEMFNRVREAREAIEQQQEASRARLEEDLLTREQMNEYEEEISRLRAEVDRVGRNVAYNEASSKCFKLDTKVILEIGKTVPISSVVVGDKVCVDASNGRLEFSEVYLIAHYDLETETEFLKIEFTSPNTGLTESITLSPDHHILTNNYFDFARNVQPYSTQLRVLNDSQMISVRVANVTKEIHKGYIAIFTRAGTLVADNVMCSCYASVMPYQSAINAFLTPLMISTKLKKSEHDGKDVHPYLGFLYNRYKDVDRVIGKVTGSDNSY